MRRPSAPRIVLLAAREDGYRSLMRLSIRAPSSKRRRTSRRTSSSTGSRARPTGLIALTGGPGGPLDRGHRRRAERISPRRAATRCSGCSATGSTSNCSATARAAERAAEPALIDLAYAQGHAAGRHQRAVISPPRDDYEAHDALICIAEGRLVAETDRRQLTPEHRFKTPRRDGGAVRRPAGGARLDRRDRASAAPSGRARRQPILPRFSVGERRRRSTRRPSCASARRRASTRRLAAHGLAPGAHRGRIPRAARLRARRHRAHEISRLLPDRRRLHPVGEGARHSGRARPRLGRRLAGRLCAHHHRPRSDPLRAAVRALPQSRARLDAGLRHRLLPGPARRGDPLRAGALRPRPGRADHHLRHAAGARRAARRRPRAADAVRPGRQALQAGAAEPGQSGDARAGDRRRAAAAGRARRRSGGQARLRHRAEARRA